tara:strand:- start:2546 stop:2905 length:360 start_codon:yes stop_codon:yes gene_type:complete
MAAIDLTFNSPINISCKVGDVAYFVNTNSLAEFTVAGQTNLIGTINSITIGSTTTTLNIEMEGELAAYVTTNDFIFFSKNNLVEIGSIVGYYAKAKFRNNSTKRAELHESACEIEESSK